MSDPQVRATLFSSPCRFSLSTFECTFFFFLNWPRFRRFERERDGKKGVNVMMLGEILEINYKVGQS